MPSPAELNVIPVMTPETRLAVRAQGDRRAKLAEYFAKKISPKDGERLPEIEERFSKGYVEAGRQKSFELYDAVHSLFDLYKEPYTKHLGLVVLNSAGGYEPLDFTGEPVGIGNFRNGNDLIIGNGRRSKEYLYSDALVLPKPGESRADSDFYVRLARTVLPRRGNKPPEVIIAPATPEEVDLGLALTKAAIEQAPDSPTFTSLETVWIDQFRLRFPDQRSPQSDPQ